MFFFEPTFVTEKYIDLHKSS